MNRGRWTGGAGSGPFGPIRLGSAIIGATILLRSDAALPPDPGALLRPPMAPLAPQEEQVPLRLPMPGYGARPVPLPLPVLTSSGEPRQASRPVRPPDPPQNRPTPRTVLLASPSVDVIATAIASQASEPPPETSAGAPEALAAAPEAPETSADEVDREQPEPPDSEASLTAHPVVPLLVANDNPPLPLTELPLPAFALSAAPPEAASPETTPPAPPVLAPELAIVDAAPTTAQGKQTARQTSPQAFTGQPSDGAPAALPQARSAPQDPPAGPQLQDEWPASTASASLDAPDPGESRLPTPRFGSARGHGAGQLRPEPAVLRVAIPRGPLSFPSGIDPPDTGQTQATPAPSPGFLVPPAAKGEAASGQSPGAPAAAVAATGPKGQKPGTGRAPEFSYDDELVLQIRTADELQGDTLIAYGTRSGTYLPLGAMARFLDLAISVSDEGHFASGWFLAEDRRFTLDLRQREFLVQGKSLQLAPDDAAAFEGELYLRAERFGEIFPLELKVNLRDQSVSIRTLEPFPFEARLARERERARLDAREETALPQKWPREKTPWQAISVPMGDVELRAVSEPALGERLEGDLRLAGDIGFMTGQAFIAGSTNDGLTGARLSLGRQDPDAAMLGPLQATEFQLGDVYSTALPLGLRSSSGRGLYLTNQPLEQASMFDRIDLRGSLPDGYEVELYRNNILIGSTRQATNGQYEFLQVPVEYGLNVLRFVFYGPQGQRREEVRRISVGDGRLSPGQMTYSLGMVQKDMNLFGVRGPRFTPGQDYAAWRYSGQLSYGITSALTATLGGAWFESDSGNHWQANAGLRTGLGGIAARLDVAMQDHGSRAYGLGLGGQLFGIGMRASHLEYSGRFIDEVRALSAEPLRRATEIDLNTSFSFGRLHLPLSARYRRVEYADGRKQTDAMLRGSTRIGRFLISNTMDYSGSFSPGFGGNKQILGAFDLATLSGSHTRLRASANYAIAPRAKLIAAGVEIDRQIDDRTSLRASINQNFDQTETLLGLSASRQMGKMLLAFDSSYGVKRRRHSVLLRLGFSFGRNPLTGRYFVAEPGMASSGVVAMRAFRDTDGDGRFGPGEPPLEGVTFSSGSQTTETDAQGQGLMTGLAGGTRTSFQVDTDSLPDIALAPATRGKEIVPRPGRIHVSDFAIVELSDVEGTAWFSGRERHRGVSGLSLVLVDNTGAIVGKTRSEADGFFLFERMKPGHYRIEIEPAQAQRLNIALESSMELNVDGSTAVLQRDLTVIQKPEASAAKTVH